MKMIISTNYAINMVFLCGRILCLPAAYIPPKVNCWEIFVRKRLIMFAVCAITLLLLYGVVIMNVWKLGLVGIGKKTMRSRIRSMPGLSGSSMKICFIKCYRKW